MSLAHDLRRRRLTAGIVTAALLVELILQGAFVVRVLDLGHRNETLLRERVAELQAAQAAQTETTACIRLFAVARDEARDKRDTAVGVRDTALADTIIVAVSRGDIAPGIAQYTAANEVATAANAAAQAASMAYSEYVTNPVLPCPITG